MGSTHKKVEANEVDTVILQRRSVRACRDIAAGERLTRRMIEFQRPCPKNAIKPSDKNKIIGKKIINNMNKGDLITFDNLS